MFIPIVSFLVNLAAALLLFLVTVGDLAIARFFTSFYFLKVAYTGGNGPQGGWLDVTYDFLTFGLWNFCEGSNNVVNACSRGQVGYTLNPIPSIHRVDEEYVSNAIRTFNKVTVLYIPATCIAFLAFLLSFVALFPRFRKRWMHGLSAILSLLVTLCSVLLLIVVFTVNGTRKVQYERHLDPEVSVKFGPGMWITLVLVPLTVFGSLFGAFAVCCPGRLERQPRDGPASKEEMAEPLA
ncbi:hypothetical protein EMPS_06039 [Entomortierella parvispora]|uniref:SUR7/PalI family-domain-containing protein n=1 Tax=Entomortierella parvispora TaxID=205924 RepID=A0A9P3HBS5_9FUNG|nr:hypothetical protein EMPS_06039 [Entomortierella parvispora]